LPQLCEAWECFAEKLKEQGKMSLYSLVKRNKPSNTDPQILFLLDHESQLPEYNDLAPLLINHLRQTIGNGTLTLVQDIRQQSETAGPISAHDKFQIMLKKNPLIQELCDGLNLKIKS